MSTARCAAILKMSEDGYGESAEARKKTKRGAKVNVLKKRQHIKAKHDNMTTLASKLLVGDINTSRTLSPQKNCQCSYLHSTYFCC